MGFIFWLWIHTSVPAVRACARVLIVGVTFCLRVLHYSVNCGSCFCLLLSLRSHNQSVVWCVADRSSDCSRAESYSCNSYCLLTFTEESLITISDCGCVGRPVLLPPQLYVCLLKTADAAVLRSSSHHGSLQNIDLSVLQCTGRYSRRNRRDWAYRSSTSASTTCTWPAKIKVTE